MKEKPCDSAGMRFFYHTVPGRMVLKLVTRRGMSRLVGRFLDSGLSKPLIKRFVQKNHIDLSLCESTDFRCFNDCFTRKLRPGQRPVDEDHEALIAPCDGLLTVYPIRQGTVFPVKQSQYTVASLLEDPALAQTYDGGLCLVFRLCVDHYHRYVYVDSGSKGENVFLPGVLHTVRPVALELFPVFVRNCREYTVIDTESFDRVVQMEVGALMVGKIDNYHGAGSCVRGEEKGRFLYGGSTIIVLLQKEKADILPDILEKSRTGEESPVGLGQRIGTRCHEIPESE